MKNIIILFSLFLIISCDYRKNYDMKTVMIDESGEKVSYSKKLTADNDRKAYIKFLDSYLKGETLFEKNTDIKILSKDLFFEGKKVEVQLSRHTVDSLITTNENIIDAKELKPEIKKHLLASTYD